MRLKVHAAPTASERHFGTWIGGSILATLGSFQQARHTPRRPSMAALHPADPPPRGPQLWMSKAEYDERGAAHILRKCA